MLENRFSNPDERRNDSESFFSPHKYDAAEIMPGKQETELLEMQVSSECISNHW
jgi:hypothetical protein